MGSALHFVIVTAALLRTEGPMDLLAVPEASAYAMASAGCIGPSLGILGFAVDSAASG
jgi:hypothetical protein